jgi:hypothetical protein
MPDSDYTDSDIEGSRKRLRVRQTRAKSKADAGDAKERTDSGTSVSGSRCIVRDIEGKDGEEKEMPSDPAEAFPVEVGFLVISDLVEASVLTR